MIRIFRTSECWHLVDDHQSLHPFVYDDLKMLLEDLSFLLEGYEKERFKNDL